MCNAISDHFSKSRVFLPVIHLPEDGRHCLAAVMTAMKAGADGVFLINQGTSTQNIMGKLIPQIRREFGQETWVGINALGSAVEDVIAMSGNTPETRLDGIWSDDAGVDSLREDEFVAARSRFNDARKTTGWKGLYFGGTAFKTQARIPQDQLGMVARRASSFVDVVTTSGPGTGMAADPERLQIMRDVISNAAMALASGVTPENASRFLPYIDAFLVASGIERSFGALDPARTKALADIIHGFGSSLKENNDFQSLAALIEEGEPSAKDALLSSFRGSDRKSLSRICMMLTLGHYRRGGRFDELLKLFVQTTGAQRGHGCECEYSPVAWIPWDGSGEIGFRFNRDAFPTDSPVVGYADDDNSPISDLRIGAGLRHLRTEVRSVEQLGRLKGHPVERHFFQILPGSAPATLTRLIGGEFNVEFCWLSEAGLKVIHEDDFCCK